ncbi:MAG TPA: Uma2 family endonuclease [Humisphaera sp.]|jgi:Uma2 family endonuclease|nr:Uma2 family endonuclease [Humisphaera sp.]
MNVVRSKPFKVGTTGWTASDLDDPHIESKWERGRYEIISGVLTRMPPAYFVGGATLLNLIHELLTQLKLKQIDGGFSVAVDLIIDEQRVVKGDSCFLTSADAKKHAAEAKKHGKLDPARARIYVPPTIVIEAVSPGHHDHDRVTKFAWYAEFGVKHFWILDAFARTLDAFVLERGKYKQVADLSENDTFRPAAFGDVHVKLADVWSKLI